MTIIIRNLYLPFHIWSDFAFWVVNAFQVIVSLGWLGQIQMLPAIAIEKTANSRDMHIVSLGNLIHGVFASAVQRMNFPDRLFRQQGIPMFFPYWIAGVLQYVSRMIFVMLAVNVFQVGKMIVRLYAVLVVYIMSIWAFAQECFSHEDMHIS